MKCPACSRDVREPVGTNVIDSRYVETENAIRRRRECPHCRTRFTTMETIVQTGWAEARDEYVIGTA